MAKPSPAPLLRSRSLVVEYLAPAVLRPNPKNPRRRNRRQLKQIAASIRTFGFNVPLLIDDDNNVIAGHGRLEAALLCQETSIPVIRLRDLNEAQARAFAIADNRLAEQSEWDDKLLGEFFSELATLNLDFSLDVTGFSMGDIDLRIEGLTSSLPPIPEESASAADSGPPVSRLGDLWRLRQHWLLCSCAQDGAAYVLLMQGQRARLVFTDPPYNVKIDGHATGNGAFKHREFAMASSEMSSGQFEFFLAVVFRLLVMHSVPGSLHFHFMDWRHMSEILAAGRQVYTELKNLCVWTKNNAGMGSLYRSQHELIFVFKNGKARHRNNVELGKHGRHRSNVWSYPGVNTFGRQGEEGNLLALHPTVKPVSLVADAILDCTARGDIVLDCFLGSGTTLLAAERTGRLCYAMELDPLYVDTAIRRWQRLTGEKAVHASTGRTFDDLAAEREASHG